MKKSFAVLLALLLAFTVFTVVPSAAGTNQEYELKFTDTAPIVDGDISSKEYGSPLVSWMVSDGEEDGIVLKLYEIDDDPDLSIDFYATWTETDLYLAWKVHTKYDFRVPDGVEDGYMYEYCCVQFILTPGAPDNSAKKYQTAEWSGDYLEVGLTMRDDGLSYKVCWSQPVAAGNALQTSDWEFAGSRDDDKQISIYECRLPLNKTGIEVKGDGAQFGLTWAVGAQENYEKVTKGLIEWQDAIVGGKAADNAAIMTMTGSGEGQQDVEVGVVSRDKCPHGDLPEGLEESLMQITLLNQPVASEQTTLILNPAKINDYNPKYAHTLLLRPAGELNGMEGYYTVVEGVTGSGDDIAFTSEVKDGDIAVLLHTDGANGSTEQAKAVELAKSLTAGQLVYLHGVQKKDGGLAFLYNNAQIAVVEDASAKLVGIWKADDSTLVLNSDKTGTLGDKAIEWSLEDDVLTIDGEAVEWDEEADTLTVGGVAYARFTPGNYTSLEAEMGTAESQLKRTEEYTEESLKALQTAYDAAKAVLEAGYGADEQAKIDEAYDALKNALTSLVKVAGETSSASSAAQSGTSAAASSSAASGEGSESSDGPSGGLIALIVALGVVVVGAIVAIIVIVRKKKAN